MTTIQVVLITSALVMASGCGGAKPPIGPTGQEVTGLIAGRWRGTQRLTEVGTNPARNYEDSCVRALPQFTVGTVTPVTLEIVGTGETQEEFGGTSSGVSASFANLLTGSSCQLHAWIHPAIKWSASLFAGRCHPDAVTIRCNSGEVRELRLLQYPAAGDVRSDVNVQLRVEGSSATGSVREIWDVFIAGRATEEDRLFLSSALSVTKQ